ncbi:U4/U6.U5 tri-snRNP-associated protein 1 isoform X2 [Diorhabda carinulata]|uniref:U4/U6.U5 tri-snRNP-associated protein 1 isoform X2 n=1 Tax=Diorhabda carinulata TaxID=1163345 RepID=UPI0025A2ACE7|nr:U4/U6.U5 tri-snRNP-associated protein 1 isoform X2 [Diorhabda carinulata]
MHNNKRSVTFTWLTFKSKILLKLLGNEVYVNLENSKKSKDRESRKRRHDDTSGYDTPKEKRHKHKKHHHKDKRRERSKYYEDDGKYRHYDNVDKKTKKTYESDDSDIIEIIDNDPSLPQDTSKSHHSESPVHTTSNKQNVESLSIEETNKLRAKLGLKPLDLGNSGSNSSDNMSNHNKESDLKKDDLGEFYHKPAENLIQKAQQEKIRSKLQEIREKRQIHSKLSSVKTLGESDSEDDLSLWVDKSRKIDQAKKEAEKRAKMLEELDAQFGISDFVESENKAKMKNKYTEKDLKGLTVQHDVDSFDEEKTVILTLKDKGVLEEDEDILQNVNMIDNERYKKNIENKKKKAEYNPYEDSEFDEYGNYQEKSLLSKYDEEIDGVKKDNFKIGFDNVIERKQQAALSIKAKLAKKRLESVADTGLKIASDYYNEEELAKFKKPKKKVRKIRSKGKLLTADELKPDNSGIEAIGSRRPKIKQDVDYDIDDVPLANIPTDLKVDDDKDDLLEKALHKARKIKQKENVIANIIKTEIKPEQEDENLDGNNIVLNATAEFCRTLGDIPTYGKSGNREETEDATDLEKEIKEDTVDSDDDCEIIEATGWNSVDTNQQGISSTQIGVQDVQILGEEPDVSTGVAAALQLAMSKGYLDKEENNRPSNSRLAHLQAKNYSIEDKAYGDDGDRQGRRERYAGPITDFKEKEGFKPNVKLEYIDDEGHILNSKEAFRYLSHKFHGKGPGKNKVEKRIQKGVQEQLMKKMSSTDTPLGTLHMLQAKQKETQSPFVVLSGNKQSQSTSLSKTRR